MLFSNYEYFLKLVQEKSFSKAADALCISQPALSKYLKRLEERLGVKLVDHQTSPVKLTYMGGLYLKYATQMMELENQFLSEISVIRNEERGTVVLGISQWRGAHILPQVLPLLAKRYPFINVSIVEGKAKTLSEELLNGRISVAIMNQYSIEGYAGLKWEKLTDEKILLAANANHPLVLQMMRSQDFCYDPKNGIFPSFDVETLADEQFILMPSDRNITQVAFEMLQRHNLHPKKIQYVDNLVTPIYHVSACMDFTFIPESGVHTNYIPDNIILFTIDTPPLARPLAVITRDNNTQGGAVKIFLDILREVYP